MNGGVSLGKRFSPICGTASKPILTLDQLASTHVIGFAHLRAPCHSCSLIPPSSLPSRELGETRQKRCVEPSINMPAAAALHCFCPGPGSTALNCLASRWLLLRIAVRQSTPRGCPRLAKQMFMHQYPNALSYCITSHLITSFRILIYFAYSLLFVAICLVNVH